MSKATELIVATFPSLGGAAAAERTLREADERLESITLGYMAVLTRNAEGEIDIDYTASRELHKKTVFTGVAGTLAATLLAGPVGLVAGAAAAYGAVNALPELGMDAADVRQIARELKRETSALVLLVNPAEKEAVTEQLANLGGDVNAFTVTESVLEGEEEEEGAAAEEPEARDPWDVAKERAGDALEATRDALASAAAAVGRMVNRSQGPRALRVTPVPASQPEVAPEGESETTSKMEDDRFVLDEDPILPAPAMSRLELPGATPKDAEKPSGS